ncbi:MAG: hypothetical protein IJV65_01860 [Kiritimatiellae bacterium]|nr:hypothetical protein [Kiritimatiellia bacterium]
MDETATTPRVSAAVPGGNVRVLGRSGRTVRLAPDMRDSSGRWFYWRFRSVFPGAGTWRFEFDAPAVGTRGPALRLADGAAWRWLSEAPFASDRAFEWTASGPETVEFCQCIPYSSADFGDFVASLAGNPLVSVGELCRSRKGRTVPLLRIREGTPEAAILLACRHHAQESMASFALEGALRALASDDSRARAMRRRAEIVAVPFVDLDGAEDGDQGKNRVPHDHNRDYGAPGGAHLYPECAAVDGLLDALRPLVALDLHCPWLRGGPTNEHPYLVGVDCARTRPAVRRLASLLERRCPPVAPYRAADTLPFGALWNTAANYADGVSFAAHASAKPFVLLANTLEIPFANFRERTQTPETVRAFGAGVAAALSDFLH